MAVSLAISGICAIKVVNYEGIKIINVFTAMPFNLDDVILSYFV